MTLDDLLLGYTVLVFVGFAAHLYLKSRER